MPEKDWEFWIDVGGTFTDCIARDPRGNLLRHKTLSSGIVKGTVHAGSSTRSIVDPIRRRDPDRFWNGWSLRLVDAVGRILTETRVTGSDALSGTLNLAPPLSQRPQPGQMYELYSGLEAPLVAMRYLLRRPLSESLPRVVIRLGTTRGTNALLTRSGAHRAGDHARIRGSASNRLPGATETVRVDHQETCPLVQPSSRGRRTHCGRWGNSHPPTIGFDSSAVAAASATRHRGISDLSAERLSTADPRTDVGRHRPRAGILGGQYVQRGRSGDQDGRARRYNGRRCLSESGPSCLRSATCRGRASGSTR